jgi:tetratricopeptide (TPR) repeat protein
MNLIIEVLARVFRREAEIAPLLDQIGFPREKRPEFKLAREFWRQVCLAVANGLTPGGLPALLAAAAKQRPHNKRLRELAEESNGPSDPRRKKAREGSVSASRLPRAPVCFGREAELADLLPLLVPADPTAKVPGIPLVGIGGIGKSTLILTALRHRRIRERYEERRYFVRLDGAGSRAAVVAAVARNVGLALGERLEPRLFDFLESGGPRLLVLDHAETPLLGKDRRAAKELLRQLAALEPLTVVATLRGVAPLGVGWRKPIQVGRLDEEAGRRTFLAHTSGLFADDPALPELLRDLDGWPLAVVLLAAQAGGYAHLGELARAWRRKRIALLKKEPGKRDADIGASIELSLGNARMTGEGRRLLALLGLLPDGIRRDDLEALLPSEGADAAKTLRQVGGLAFDDGPRIRVLAPVREYLAANHPPEAEDRDRAIRFYCRVADEDGNKVGGVGGSEASARIAAETGNLLVMVRLGLQGADPEPAFRGALGLGEFARFSGVDLSAVLVEAEVVAANAGNCLRQARCLQRRGDIALARSEHAEARQRYEEALALFRQVGSVHGKANCIKSLGHIALERSQHAESRQRYEEALPLFRQVGDVLGEANCIQSLGDIALVRSQHPEARQRYEEALPLFRQIGDVLGKANCILSLGHIALEHSQHAEARQRYEEALALYRQLGHVLGEANCIQSLGDIALERSEHADARQRYEEALPLHRQVGDVLGEANCILSLGDLAGEETNVDEARQLFETALALFERIEDPFSIGWSHRRMARLTAGAERKRHLKAAGAAWTRIGRSDLVAEMNKEFSRRR